MPAMMSNENHAQEWILTVVMRVDHAGHHDTVLHVQHQIGRLAARWEVRRGPHPLDLIAFDIHGGIADLAEISIVRRQHLDMLQEKGPCRDPPSRASSTHHTPPAVAFSLDSGVS